VQNGNIPDPKVVIPETHCYSRVGPNPHTGPPNLTINVKNLTVSRVIKRVILSRNGIPEGLYPRVLVYSQEVEKRAFPS